MDQHPRKRSSAAMRIEAMMHALLVDHGFRIHRPHCEEDETVYYHLTEPYEARVLRLDRTQVLCRLRNGRPGTGWLAEADSPRRLHRTLDRLL